MTATRPGDGPDDRETGSWTCETLPLSVRKELLERELNRLGFRRAGVPGGGVRDAGGALQRPQQQQQQQQQQQPQPQGGSERPSAGKPGD